MWIRLFFLGFAAFLALALAACDNSAGRPSDRPERVVLVAPVHFASQAQSREFVASIRPRIETDQGFRVTGKVVRRFVENGQRVKRGDLLATLDDADLRLQKEQAEAELAAARMALQQATADEARAIKLRKDGWTAQAALDRQRTAAEEARGRAQRASRAVELAGNSLDYASLKADADGVVTATSIEPGQVVAAGQAAVRIARSGELEAVVAVPEAFVSAAGSGEASLFLWSNPGKLYRAKLRELSPSADPVTRTFAARYSIAGADASVALGMSATLAIKNPGAGTAAAVPLAALFNQGKGPSVWKVDGEGNLTLAPVSVARYEAKTALLSGGVKEGETIVILGAHKLDPGQKVRPVPADAL